MENRDILAKTTLTNVTEYCVSDTDCEDIILKALHFGVDKVILSPSSAAVAKKYDGVKYGVSIAYPSGAVYPELKAAEITDYEENCGGADEYYVSAAVGFYRSGHEDNLEKEMEQCVAAAKGKPVYFFIEAAEMSDDEIAFTCKTAEEKGVTGIVASNGFMSYDIKRSGPDDIKRINGQGRKIKVLACGCMDERKDVEACIEAGADGVILRSIDQIVF